MSAQEQRHFLIIDPDSQFRAQVRDFLGSMGYSQTQEASRMKDALEILNHSQIDGIISDWDTPGANGFTLLKLIRGQERYQGMIFILMSKPDDDAQRKIIRAGSLRADGFLLKPFLLSTFESVLKKALQVS